MKDNEERLAAAKRQSQFSAAVYLSTIFCGDFYDISKWYAKSRNSKLMAVLIKRMLNVINLVVFIIRITQLLRQMILSFRQMLSCNGVLIKLPELNGTD
uniref:Uncharacterized protein n=1 Tax=Globodera rostochiensis TaxID=31243 RepID=A0A914H6G5_GLORO